MSKVKNAIGLTGASILLILLTMLLSVNVYANENQSAADTDTTAETDTTVEAQDFGSLLIFGDDDTLLLEEGQTATEDTASTAAAQTAASSTVSLGTFKLTAYCPCYKCSEGYGARTSTGKTAQVGRTIAVDPRVIPYGSRVMINGHEYIAEDCGGAIKQKKIDIFFSSHAQAMAFGVQYAEVFLVR